MMFRETELKFKIKDAQAKLLLDNMCVEWSVIKQGYLYDANGAVVRIRHQDNYTVTPAKGKLPAITTVESVAYITHKRTVEGLVGRIEYEYKIDEDEALRTFDQSPDMSGVIEKTRYYLNGWEIDLFHGDNDGLVIAEYEVDSEEDLLEFGDELNELPFIDVEPVTHDSRYINSNLTRDPYKFWKDTLV